MELSEIYVKLKTIGIPVAYLKFDTPQDRPFIVYYENGADFDGADNFNLYSDTGIMIELYFDKKDKKLEHRIEKLFRDVELSKSPDIYIPEENIIKIEYTFDTIQYIQEG